MTEYYTTEFGFCSNSRCDFVNTCELYLQYKHYKPSIDNAPVRHCSNRCYIKHRVGKKIGAVKGLNIIYEVID